MGQCQMNGLPHVIKVDAEYAASSLRPAEEFTRHAGLQNVHNNELEAQMHLRVPAAAPCRLLRRFTQAPQEPSSTFPSLHAAFGHKL